MTEAEARTIVEKIRQGKRLMTRHQEDSWGIYYDLNNGRFLHHSERLLAELHENGRYHQSIEKTETTYTEAELITFLAKHYSYARLEKLLR